MFRLFLIMCFFILNVKLSAQNYSGILEDIQLFKYKSNCQHWKWATLLNTTEKKPAKTAVLIIAPPSIGKSHVELRWKLGKKVWELYMNTHSDVDCYFIQSACFKKNSSETVWIEGNTIYVSDTWYERERNDRILNKTVKALELLLPHYTHFFRTNINTFFDLGNLHKYAETHHQSMFTTPLWQGEWYAVGYSIFFTQDVAAHICREYERLDQLGEELISCYHSDDAAITALATGIWPENEDHPFKCCPSLSYAMRQLMCEASYDSQRFARYGVLLSPVRSLQEAISFCNQASPDVILYRTRDGLNLLEFAKLYEHMLSKHYPMLPPANLVEYLKSEKGI